MSKLFAIYAYEEMYMGLHGRHNYLITEANNMAEAEETAIDLAINVVESYHDINTEVFNNTVADFCSLDEYEDMTEDEKAKIYNSEEFLLKYVENRDEILRYKIVELDEEATRGLTLDYLNSLSFDEVCDEYGK
nr:MAG TPA: hypothetical protein [Caudoviricetes sp.]